MRALHWHCALATPLHCIALCTTLHGEAQCTAERGAPCMHGHKMVLKLVAGRYIVQLTVLIALLSSPTAGLADPGFLPPDWKLSHQDRKKYLSGSFWYMANMIMKGFKKIAKKS